MIIERINDHEVFLRLEDEKEIKLTFKNMGKFTDRQPRFILT